MFCSLLLCFDSKFGVLKSQLELKGKIVSILNSDLGAGQRQVEELRTALSHAHQEIAVLNQTTNKKTQQIEACLNDINDLNSRLSQMILHRSTDNDNISFLNDKISSLQSEVNTLQTSFNAKGISTSQTSNVATAKPRRTRSDLDKYSGAQKDAEKRQTMYESWKTQVHQENLPNADDYAGWSEMINSIARNLQQQQHIAKLQTLPSITRPSEPHVILTAPDLEDPMPMDLSRMRLLLLNVLIV
ncbi:putative chromosome segregation protein [Erysiphe necator]|uniref:Putative chromosome segregation protein n=1 Tax=Uncinula necator TaxID=52586 RepID=A0A0B1NZ87_UNCNE|nr:putative chromosome segregation protein [Erysiphe necator]